MAFRTLKTNFSKEGFQVFEDSAENNLIDVSAPDATALDLTVKAICQFPRVKYSYSNGAGFFAGGREGFQQLGGTQRLSYYTLGIGNSNEQRVEAAATNRTRHLYEEYYGFLHGKSIAIGDGLIAIARPAPGAIPVGVETYGVDLFNYDGTYIKTLDPRNVIGGDPAEMAPVDGGIGANNRFDFGTSISIGGGRLLITNPYIRVEHGASGAFNSQGAAYLFDLDGNQLSHRYNDKGGYMNVQNGGSTTYSNATHLMQTDLSTRWSDPGFFFYDPQFTGFGMNSAIGEGRIVITAPYDVKEDLHNGNGNSFIGRGAFHIYDLDLNHIRTIKNPDFNEQRVLDNSDSRLGTGSQGYPKAYANITDREEGFAKSIAIGDGRIIVGAPNWWDPADFNLSANPITSSVGKGKVYAFDLDGNLLWSVKNPSANGYYECFGNAVAVGSGRVVVGNYMKGATSRHSDNNPYSDGAVYIYDLNGNLISSDTGSSLNDGTPAVTPGETDGEWKGFSVDVSDNLIYVTSRLGGSNGVYRSGKLTIMDLDGDIIATDSSGASEDDFYGELVAAADGKVLVAAPGATVGKLTGGSYSYHGKAYVYEPGPKTRAFDTWGRYNETFGNPIISGNIDYRISTNLQEIKVSDYISDGGTLYIDSDAVIWSDDTSIPAIDFDIDSGALFISGTVMGKGGQGGYRNAPGGNGEDGGDAIKINGVGNFIFLDNINGVSGYIAGGGGGGAGSPDDGDGDDMGHGGGGAGGGAGGGQLSGRLGGAGGAVGKSGSNGGSDFGVGIAVGGGAGGGGGGATTTNGGGGGGGGRIIPGLAGAGGNSTYDGGDGGNAGNPGDDQDTVYGGGGGGGWGAAGGDAGTNTGGAGGAAINATGIPGGVTVGGNTSGYSINVYGAMNGISNATTSYTVTSDTQELLASDVIDRFGTITINSGVYVWSDDTSKAGLTIDVPDITIINNGYIIGRGGNAGQDGGPALSIEVPGVTITNNSGAFIAGGGGGGGGSIGGGGAGGGGPSGGSLGQAGGNGSSTTSVYLSTFSGVTFVDAPCNNTAAMCYGNVTATANTIAAGGNQGGGSGSTQSVSGQVTCYVPACDPNNGGQTFAQAGYTPTTRSASGTATFTGGSGGRILNAASNTNGAGSAGGGGWGAAGGGSGAGAGGAGISLLNVASYTLTNNGTIYGSS